jgi:SAM-dependent methyltransferase
VTSYDREFFKASDRGALAAGRVLVPLLVDWLHPSSALDVGCGSGAFLSEFVRCGVVDVRGIDSGQGDHSLLRIRRDQFEARDLEQRLEQHGFDLVLSLEVAEHLSPSRAGSFVHDLCRAAEVVVFSAAIPFQRGIHHVNEQWPDYWRALFAQHGYLQFDVVRPALWDVPGIGAPYAQNTYMYAAAGCTRVDRLAQLASFGGVTAVHPRLWHDRHAEPRVRYVVGDLLPALGGAIRYRARRSRRR